jgi:hypothetical protein
VRWLLTVNWNIGHRLLVGEEVERNENMSPIGSPTETGIWHLRNLINLVYLINSVSHKNVNSGLYGENGNMIPRARPALQFVCIASEYILQVHPSDSLDMNVIGLAIWEQSTSCDSPLCLILAIYMLFRLIHSNISLDIWFPNILTLSISWSSRLWLRVVWLVHTYHTVRRQPGRSQIWS